MKDCVTNTKLYREGRKKRAVRWGQKKQKWREKERESEIDR